ncbi:MAG: translation initiation factor IF-3 [Bacilli bacterium]
MVNNAIRSNEVFVIGPNGEQLGIKTKQDALVLAQAAGFDLVAVNSNAVPPVCKLMDYNKYRYEKNKKTKEANKKQRAKNLSIKEFRLSPSIDQHDFSTKLRNVTKYLEKNNKIKVWIRFKGGRALAHVDLGKDVLIRFADALKDLCEIEKEPKLEGRVMTMVLIPKVKNKEG